MTFPSESPFDGPVPDSILLRNTPLTGVVVQVKFPEVLSIARVEYIAEFQERIRSCYPLHAQHHGFIFQVTPHGAQPDRSPLFWRFLDTARKWRVSVGTNFLALETRAYESRQDLVQRSESVANALSKTINPALMTRIGVRYVDRICGDNLERLHQFVRPEVLGLYNRDHQASIVRTISEVVGDTNVGTISVRCGFMPPNQTHEHDLMPAIGTPSWFLDVDVYQEYGQPQAFDPSEINVQIMELASRAYGFFRWAVSTEFLRAYGGVF